MFTKLKKSKGESEKGFTIIEVMIVLAIAGLILLIVFLAIPALQRNSRNTQRKSAASQILTSISNYVSNHNGTLPASQGTVNTARADYKPGFYTISPNRIYYGSNTAIPSSVGAVGTESASVLTTENVIYFKGVTCDATTNLPTTTGASTRSYAVLYAVETGGAATPQCIAS